MTLDERPGRTPGHPRAFHYFLTVFTLLLTLVYALIPYKTPWCLLSFLLGMALLAGQGAALLVESWKCPWGKLGTTVVLVTAVAQLGYQSYRTSFVAYADPGNPYAYAQPVPDIENLAQRVARLTAASSEGGATVIKVFSVDTYYWPLPWYLRRYPNVGYWTQVPLGADAEAPIVLASPEFDDELTRRLPNHLMTKIYKLRGDTFFEAWVRLDLWQSYLDKKKALGSTGSAG